MKGVIPSRENIVSNIQWIIEDSYSVGFDNGQDSREPLHAESKLENLVWMIDQYVSERIIDKLNGLHRTDLSLNEKIITEKTIQNAIKELQDK